MGSGRSVGGEWAERGGDTELQNIHEHVVEVEKMSKRRNKRREMDGSWAEAGRRMGGAGAERGGESVRRKMLES